MLREKLEASQKEVQQSNTQRTKKIKSPHKASTSTHDLFIVNEENCRLQDTLNEFQRQACDADSILIEKNHEIDKLNRKIAKQNEVIEFKDARLRDATKELDDLQGGI